MQNLFPEEYNFYPRSWILPDEFQLFTAQVDGTPSHGLESYCGCYRVLGFVCWELGPEVPRELRLAKGVSNSTQLVLAATMADCRVEQVGWQVGKLKKWVLTWGDSPDTDIWSCIRRSGFGEPGDRATELEQMAEPIQGLRLFEWILEVWSQGMKCGRSGSASRPGSRSDKLRGGGNLLSVNLFQNQFSNHPFHIEAVCLSMKYFVENQSAIYVLVCFWTLLCSIHLCVYS